MAKDHWDFKAGDSVFVNGRGIGVVEELIEDGRNSQYDRVTVKVTYDCKCNCGNEHQAVEVVKIHPMYVKLTPTSQFMRIFNEGEQPNA